MTYHIKQIDNQSDRSVALTNPKTGTSKRDCVLILPAPSQKRNRSHPPITRARRTVAPGHGRRCDVMIGLAVVFAYGLGRSAEAESFVGAMGGA
jgi:hypothetical protein